LSFASMSELQIVDDKVDSPADRTEAYEPGAGKRGNHAAGHAEDAEI